MLVGCAASAPAQRTNAPAPAVPVGGASAELASGITSAPAAAPRPAGTAASSQASNQANADTERMVIRNASLKLVVKNTEENMSDITKLAEELGGFVNSSSTTKFSAGLQATMVLKIPSKQFDVAMERLRKMAVEVQEERITGQDVTAEYADLDAQLKNLEAAEKQLRGILEKAEKTDDVIKIFNELTKVRGQIEQIKGRMNFFSRSAAMATINVTLTPDKLAEPVAIPGWRPQGIVKQAFEAMVSALQALATIAIWGVIFALPIGLLVFGPPLLLIRWWASRRKKKAVNSVAPVATKN